jgi:serine/threonine protein kinase
MSIKGRKVAAEAEATLTARGLKLGPQIGSGSHGVVHSVMNVRTCETFAIKIMPNVTDETREVWLREAKCLRKAVGSSVVQIIDSFEDERAFFISMEQCDSDLFTMLETHLPDEDEARLFFAQLLLSVEHLHRRGIIHRDVKPENLLLCHKSPYSGIDGVVGPTLKLADFGSAVCDLPRRFHHLAAEKRSKLGTLAYLAPEMLDPSVTEFGESIDLWACGIVLYIMMIGSFPFNQADASCSNFRHYLREGIQFFPPHLSLELRELLASLLSVDALRRPTVRDALRCPWFCNAYDSDDSGMSSPNISFPSPPLGLSHSSSSSHQSVPSTTPPASPLSLLPSSLPASSSTKMMSPYTNASSPVATCASQALAEPWFLEVKVVPPLT